MGQETRNLPMIFTYTLYNIATVLEWRIIHQNVFIKYVVYADGRVLSSAICLLVSICLPDYAPIMYFVTQSGMDIPMNEIEI